MAKKRNPPKNPPAMPRPSPTDSTAPPRIAAAANSLVRRLLRENLRGGRAAHWKRILAAVSQELTSEHGEGFTLRSPYRAIHLSQLFSDEGIVSALSTQLSWSRFLEAKVGTTN